MKKYKVKIGFSGYSRGHDFFVVEADSPEDAIENWWDGDFIERVTIRDDTEHEAEYGTAEEIKDAIVNDRI